MANVCGAPRLLARWRMRAERSGRFMRPTRSLQRALWRICDRRRWVLGVMRGGGLQATVGQQAVMVHACIKARMMGISHIIR